MRLFSYIERGKESDIRNIDVHVTISSPLYYYKAPMNTYGYSKKDKTYFCMGVCRIFSRGKEIFENFTTYMGVFL